MSSRANRRAVRSSRSAQHARGRRTPVRPAGARRSFPWIPIVVVAGVAVLLVAVVYLVIQAGQSRGNDLDKWAQLEKDTATDTTLPGEGVDLQTIYDGSYGSSDNNTGDHVQREMDYATDQGLPPVGGPHWGSGACGDDPTNAPPFCGPVPWGIYRAPWDAEALVHNMEHGGVVVWYNTTDQQIISELEDDIAARLEKDQLLVMTPFPDMADETVAITAWGRRETIPVGEYSKDRVDTFIDAFKCRFNPESMPGAGC